MKQQLVVDVQRVGSVSLVNLQGFITEDSKLAEITNRILTPVAVINTAQVDRINSTGVRDWVHWVGQLEKRGITTYFAECSPSIMAQVNLVINFIGSGTILSFFAPYYCPQCSCDRLVLLNLAEVLAVQPPKPPICRCNQCDHLLRFDEKEDFFFSFLEWAKAGPINPGVESVLESLATERGEGYYSRLTKVGTSGRETTPPFDAAISTTQDIALPADTGSKSSLSMVAIRPKTATPKSPAKILYAVAVALGIAVVILIFIVLRVS
jgi:anti-anti-sigma regulatory factor